MLLGLDHIALAVSDIPKAASFYCDLLGMRRVDAREPTITGYFWVSFGAGQSINLVLDPENTPNRAGKPLDRMRSPHAAFVTAPEHLDIFDTRLSQAGVKVHRTETGLYFTDPDGNFLELTCWREADLRASGAKHW